ncbi:mycothiol synthase [Paraoerskovia marina]|uniref:Mycothiol acetyltransferase n=1 Tax=Paraoerskovia marina TaxID=545619 RepID=A0A1H1W0T0_9CELL|nr:mycothiol synthase [Paraoerskovia marina]SDS90717.1 mycothiol synthase [Paraoerskovia marina]
MRPDLEIGPPDDATATAVRTLAAAAAAADGVPPLSEQPLLNLRTDSADLTHAVVRVGDDVVGYAQVDRGADPASAELVVHPDHRRRGLGTTLLRTAVRDARLPARSGAPGRRSGRLHVWAHGYVPAAQAFAAALGWEPVRDLRILERALSPADSDPQFPDGLRLRTARPNDDAAWLDLNSRAFADHPEQGRTTQADLDARRAEAWFREDGLRLLVPDDGAPLGFIWTKVDPENPSEGEIYVVGVDPAAQGRGLGRALTIAGLAQLAARGCTTAVLYVDGDNAAAVHTYAALGFDARATDVQLAPSATRE